MVTIVRIDAPDDAQRDLFDAWAEVFLASARSILGEDHTARPVAELRALGHSPDRRRTVLAAVEGDTVVGGIGIVLPLHDNLAVAMVNLAVHPGHLRRGVGTALLAAGESVAREQGRTVLLAETQWPVGGRDDSGEGFAARHGYAAAQTTLRSALSLPADAGRLGALLAGDGADGYLTRTCWDGIPEQWLEGRAELSRRMSTDIPLGEMQLEEEVWDADRVREDYRQVATLGRRVVDTFAVEVATGELVGWTQVQVPQDLPGVAFQHDTLVLREHRGHGLGLRVKAASTLSLMQESPETTRRRPGCARGTPTTTPRCSRSTTRSAMSATPTCASGRRSSPWADRVGRARWCAAVSLAGMSEHSGGADPTDTHGFATRAIHAGQEPDPGTGAVITPIFQVSTYKQDGIGGFRGGYEYSRSANPTRTALEECFAALEGGARGFAFASGLAGQDTVLRALLAPGDHVVVPSDAYGGTYRLFNKVLTTWGVEHSIAKIADPESVRAAIRPGSTKVVWVETPTNPLLGIADITALADIAHEAGALLVVDNTFASPYLQQPLSLGADIVTHSTTKYCGGHSDVVGGGVVVSRDVAVEAFRDAADRIAFHQNSMGAVAGPMDAWLVLRGLKTLAVRMERHCDNAERVVEFLTSHPAVSAVHYPGLESHPGHEVASRQMKRFGGMVSFQLRAGEDVAVKVCGETTLWTLGESLGGVESLIEHPARMTHASVAGTELEVPADLVRLSVGIEDVEDLIADLKQALDRLG